ncbi:MAG: poly(R)-hydroxyalkanoic acid synthase subunit PhaE [Nitrosopumilus sp.]
MQPNSPKEITDYYKHLSLFWTDLIHLMSSKPQALASTGPMRAFAANSKKITTELIEINEDLMGFNQYLTEYYKQLASAWEEAQKKVNLKAPEVPQDVEQIEAFKRIWIDIFDNDFTELFDSKKFGENYGKLVSKELELTKHWNNITNVVLQSVNLPSKEEIDEVYKELHSLKKRVGKLELQLKKKEMKKNA